MSYDDVALTPALSGLFVYDEDGDSLVELIGAGSFSGEKNTLQLFNDAFARAYYGCKIWETMLTTRPQAGTGFFRYIDPDGNEVFFPMSWLFSKRPPAFFLAVPEDVSKEVVIKREDISYVNVYASLAQCENTTSCLSYFRVEREKSSAFPAIAVAYGNSNVCIDPTHIKSSEGTEVRVSIATISTNPLVIDDLGLSPAFPATVGVVKLRGGQLIGVDYAAWRTPGEETKLTKHLPPLFVPLEGDEETAGSTPCGE